MASPAAKAALERRLRGASARVTPRDDDDDTINNDAQATPRPPPFSPDEVPTQGKEIPKGDATPRDEDLRDASPRQGRSIPMDTSSFIYCPPRPPSLRETANADRAFLKEVMGDASTSLAGAEYGLKQVNELFRKIRLLNLNDEAATAFVDANRAIRGDPEGYRIREGQFWRRRVGRVGGGRAGHDDGWSGRGRVRVLRAATESFRVGRRPQGLLAKRRRPAGHAPNVSQTAGGGTGLVDGPHRRCGRHEQMQVVADRYLAMGSARIYHNDAARQATCAAADCYRMCCDYAASAAAASTAARAAFIKDTAASATDFAKAANAASDASKQMMEAARYRAVWNQILRRVRAESSRRPPRHRRDACSMAWQCRFLTARRSQRGHVIAEK